MFYSSFTDSKIFEPSSKYIVVFATCWKDTSQLTCCYISISSLTSRGVWKLLAFSVRSTHAHRKAPQSRRSAHIQEALQKSLPDARLHGILSCSLQVCHFLWNSVVYLELICTSFSVACKATCLMHIFIMSDVLHLACVYLLYNVSFHIISLPLHPSSSARSVPVPPSLQFINLFSSHRSHTPLFLSSGLS